MENTFARFENKADRSGLIRRYVHRLTYYRSDAMRRQSPQLDQIPLRKYKARAIRNTAQDNAQTPRQIRARNKSA